MKPTIASLVSTFGAVSALAFLLGLAYTVDCRYWSKTWDQASACYLTGGSLMGLGGIGKAAGGAFGAGYNTYNPALRSRAAKGVLDPDGDPPIS